MTSMISPARISKGATVMRVLLYTASRLKTAGSVLLCPPDIKNIPTAIKAKPASIHIRFFFSNSDWVLLLIVVSCLTKKVVLLVQVVELHFKVFDNATVGTEKRYANAQ